MNNKGMYLGKFAYRDGGLVRMDPGGPINPNYKWYYDPNISTAENLELNRRAELAGHNSVAEYRASGWAWQPEKTHYIPGAGQGILRADSKSYNKYDYKRPSVSSVSGVINEAKQREAKLKDARGYYDKHLSVQNILDEAHRAAPEIAKKEMMGKYKMYDPNNKYANIYNEDAAGLPSVPIFESLLMAPVAAGEAGLTGLVRAAPSVGTAIWDGLGSLGSTIGSELASAGSSIYEGGAALAGEIGQGFNALKNFAAPVTEAWGSAMNAPVLGNNALTGANAFKTLAAYDLSHKYIPNAYSDVNKYAETGDIDYLKDAGYNAGKGFLEVGSSMGPFMSEMSAVKKPASFLDDARKAADADRDLGSRGISGIKTIKNTMGYLQKDGGNTYGRLPKAKVGDELDWEAVKNPELAAKAKAMGHNTIAEYRNSNWGYGNFGFNENKKQPPATNTPPIPRITDPAEQEKIDYLQAKNKLKLRQQLESAQARNADLPNIIEVAKNRNKGMDAIKEMHQKYPDDKRLSVKEDRAMEETGDFLMQQAAQKLVPKPIGTAQDIISFPDQLQQWAAAQKEAEAQYGSYEDELQHKVDTYEKAQGTYQPGLFNELRTQMKMPMAPSSLSFAYGGDIAVPNLKRVRIKALPKNWKSQ